MLFRALKKVFKNPIYIIVAIVVSMVVFSFAVWLPNLSLITKTMVHTGISIAEKVQLPFNLLGSIKTNFTLLSASYTIAMAILFGVNLSMIIYFLKRKISTVKKGGMATSFLGIASGVLGIGCAACGSLLLTALLSIFGASWMITLLPLKGGEFGILGVILLIISIYTISKQIENPAVCSI